MICHRLSFACFLVFSNALNVLKTRGLPLGLGTDLVGGHAVCALHVAADERAVAKHCTRPNEDGRGSGSLPQRG